MGLLKKLFTNCACPQGRMGRAMLKFNWREKINIISPYHKLC